MGRDRYVHYDDHSDVTTPVGPRRVEFLTGSDQSVGGGGRTRPRSLSWAEALADGVVVSDIARRHDVRPSQLFGWIRQFRDVALATSAGPDAPLFAPAVVEVAPMSPPPPPAEPPAEIEIRVGCATVRIRGAVEGRTLATVLKALRALA